MSYFKDIQIALDTRLAALTGGTPIAWESVTYTPVNGTAYIRPTLLLAPSSLLNLTDKQMQEGIYQIDLFYPSDGGMGDLLDKADAVYTHFKASTPLTSNSVDVHIKQIGRPAAARVEDGWLMSIIEVHFKTYVS